MKQTVDLIIGATQAEAYNVDKDEEDENENEQKEKDEECREDGRKDGDEIDRRETEVVGQDGEGERREKEVGGEGDEMERREIEVGEEEGEGERKEIEVGGEGDEIERREREVVGEEDKGNRGEREVVGVDCEVEREREVVREVDKIGEGSNIMEISSSLLGDFPNKLTARSKKMRSKVNRGKKIANVVDEQSERQQGIVFRFDIMEDPDKKLKIEFNS